MNESSSESMYPAEIIEAFWSQVAVCEHGRLCRECCWPWRGLPLDDMYGSFSFYTEDGRRITSGAHRFALELALGVSLGISLACHTCDNPPCCNDAHLYRGTHQSNADDRKSRKRFRVRAHGGKRDIDWHGLETDSNEAC